MGGCEREPGAGLWGGTFSNENRERGRVSAGFIVGDWKPSTADCCRHSWGAWLNKLPTGKILAVCTSSRHVSLTGSSDFW